jgi:hypothetical protein
MGRGNFHDEMENACQPAPKHDREERSRAKELRLADQHPREHPGRILAQTVSFARRMVTQVATCRVWRAAGASNAAAAVQAHFRWPPRVRNKEVAVVLAILSLPVVGISLIYVNAKVRLVYWEC